MESRNGIDLATYNDLKDLMGVDFIKELIDTYISETEQLLGQLKTALDANDAATFGRSAHSIKSSSASLGALAFAQQARELEMMGKADALTGADEKLACLAASFINVKHRLEELRDES